MPLARLIERRRDDLALHRTLHVGHFLRPLVDEKNDENDLGVVSRDRVRDLLEQDGLAGARRSDDQGALSLAEGRHEVEHPVRDLFGAGLHLEPLLRIERRERIEVRFVAREVGRLEVDGVDFDEREVTLVGFGGSDLAADGVAGAQIELADLRGRDIDVIGTREVAVLGSAKEAEAFGQDFEHAFREDEAEFLGLGAQDLEDQFLLLHIERARNLEVFGNGGEIADRHFLELRQVETRSFSRRCSSRDGFQCVGIILDVDEPPVLGAHVVVSLGLAVLGRAGGRAGALRWRLFAALLSPAFRPALVLALATLARRSGLGWRGTLLWSPRFRGLLGARSGRRALGSGGLCRPVLRRLRRTGAGRPSSPTSAPALPFRATLAILLPCRIGRRGLPRVFRPLGLLFVGHFEFFLSGSRF